MEGAGWSGTPTLSAFVGRIFAGEDRFSPPGATSSPVSLGSPGRPERTRSALPRRPGRPWDPPLPLPRPPRASPGRVLSGVLPPLEVGTWKAPGPPGGGYLRAGDVALPAADAP